MVTISPSKSSCLTALFIIVVFVSFYISIEVVSNQNMYSELSNKHEVYFSNLSSVVRQSDFFNKEIRHRALENSPLDRNNDGPDSNVVNVTKTNTDSDNDVITETYSTNKSVERRPGKRAENVVAMPMDIVDVDLSAPLSAISKNNTSPPFIIVMGLWRFGSSVIGELFNQNSNIFYIFEPLWATNKLRNMTHIKPFTNESQELSRGILRRFSKCKFGAEFVNVLNSWGGRNKNKAICQKSPMQCKLINPIWMKGVCKKYHGRLATKLIRANLELLKALIVDDDINIKIVHLVRDPRGAAASRINYNLMKLSSQKAEVRSQFPQLGRLQPLGLLNSTPETYQTVRGMCKWLRENAKMSADLLPVWLRGRYHLVRYEDFADTPLKVTKELYKFVGIPLPKEIQTWVAVNTHATQSDQGLFTMRKDSRATAGHWMHYLNELEINQIEKECLDVLELLGYQPYSQLKNEK